MRSDPDGNLGIPNPKPLDFEREMNADTTSWARADPKPAHLEPIGKFGWLVLLPEGEGHLAAIAHDGDEQYVGFCKCKGFRFHEGPCAHLCTLRKAAFIDAHDVNGEPVRIAEFEEYPGEIRERWTEAFVNHRWVMNELTEAEREVWLKVEKGPYGGREYARETDRAWGTVWNLLRRARDKLGGEEP